VGQVIDFVHHPVVRIKKRLDILPGALDCVRMSARMHINETDHMFHSFANSHLQHIILRGISPTSFQNWTPTSWSLNKNAMNNLGKPLATSVASEYVVEVTYDFSL